MWADWSEPMHPTNRAERRHIREVWRNYRRYIIYALWHSRNLEDAMQNTGWDRGGKQYFACGNRCLHSKLERWSDHLDVKRLRREPIEWDDEE